MLDRAGRSARSWVWLSSPRQFAPKSSKNLKGTLKDRLNLLVKDAFPKAPMPPIRRKPTAAVVRLMERGRSPDRGAALVLVWLHLAAIRTFAPSRAPCRPRGAGRGNEALRRWTRAHSAPHPHIPGGEGHHAADRAGGSRLSAAAQRRLCRDQSADAGARAGAGRRHGAHGI